MTDDTQHPHQFKLSAQGFTIELSGSRPFVENQAEHWWRRLQPWLNTPKPETPADPFPRVSATFQPSCNVSVPEFLELKDAHAPDDILVTVAYYLEKYHRKEQYSVSDLQQALNQAPETACLAIDHALESAMARGHIERLHDGTYTLTYRGQSYVREGLSE